MIQEAPLIDIDTSGVRKLELSSRTENRLSPEDWEVFGALQEFNNSQTISPNWAIYNTVSVPAPEIPGTIFLSRAVNMRSVREGEPDWNSLHVCVIDPRGNRQRLKDLELPVDDEMVNWEDPRVGTNGTLGFTVVFREGNKYNPHPALVKVGIEDGNLKVVEAPKIFKNITGKNIIPLENGIIYRPDGVSHQLHYLNPQGELLKIIDFSNFRNIEWFSKKMGATARPIELEDGLKLLLIHGVQGGRGIGGSIKDDIYAIGIAVLDETWHVRAVDQKPLLERGDFLGNLQPNEDLRSEKEVVYLCDFTERKDGLILPVNVGDRITVFTRISYSQLRTRIKNLLLE
ncbi:MAG: hypothetical protein ABIJ05_01450 [Patescibacteria group bacterium]